MTPKKLSVFLSFFPYGSNGGSAVEHPSIRNWLAKTLTAAAKDERVSALDWADFNDTPITMTRNRAVQEARARDADVLVMVDSDNHPDLYDGKDPGAKPFFASSFDFLYKRWDRGPVAVGSPYCGPPPIENIYIFKWRSNETFSPNFDYRLDQYTRDEAAAMAGIQDCAVLPTGVIMFDIRMFDLIQPPYFRYEWTDEYEQQKASTEDVFCTRDMSLCGYEKLGYNPVFCNWDSWAGHYKPKCVGKPMFMTADMVNESFKRAVRDGRCSDERMINVNGLHHFRNNGFAELEAVIPDKEPS